LENRENAFLIIPYGHKREVLSLNKKRVGHYDAIPYFFVHQDTHANKIIRLVNKFIAVFHTAGLIYRRRNKKKVDAIILGGAVDIIRDSPIIFMCAILRIPLYIWFVEKMSLNIYSGIPGFLNHWSQKMTEAFLPCFASGVIVISSYLKKHYLKYLMEDKILISPILVSQNMQNTTMRNTKYIAKEKLDLKCNCKYLLVYSGSYGEKDGIFYLIDAFAKVVKKYPDTLFIMTGKNDSKIIMSSVESYIHLHNLQDYMQLVGFVNSEELFYYNHFADILFACRTNSPFANHGFPWKLGEYCMTCKPIIATKVSDIELYFKDNDDLLIVEPSNSKAIADKIDFVLSNYDEALVIANKGKETALKNFGYLEKTREIIDFIKVNNNF